MPTAATRSRRPSAPFDERTHFSLSWVRLPGAEDCISAKQLSRAVEARLHRPALGAPAETDVAIEGFIEKTDDALYHAVVTIADARGAVLGKRELERPLCHDMDAALALAVALMIDPDAAFAPTATPAAPRSRSPAAPASASTAKPKSPMAFRTTAVTGVTFGFGTLPANGYGALLIASVIPPHFLPIEVGANLWVDQTTSVGKQARVAFSRASLDVAMCPLDAHVSLLRFGACGGLAAGTLSASGIGHSGLMLQRQAIVDVVARGHVGLFVLPHFAVAVIPSLGIPLIRDSFDYLRDDGTLDRAFRLPVVYGEVGVGVGLELP